MEGVAPALPPLLPSSTRCRRHATRHQCELALFVRGDECELALFVRGRERGTALFVRVGESEPFLFVRGGETETALVVRREGRAGSVPSRWKSDALTAMVWCETRAPAARSACSPLTGDAEKRPGAAACIVLTTCAALRPDFCRRVAATLSAGCGKADGCAIRLTPRPSSRRSILRSAQFCSQAHTTKAVHVCRPSPR